MSTFAKVIFFSSCATIFAGTTYVVGIAFAPPPTFKVSNEQRINKFDEIAAEYERKTKRQEFYLGIGRWRRKILKQAHGRVLEVGCGTGSNLELYQPDQCDEVIFCDRSPHMIDVAINKIETRLGYEPFSYPEFTWTESDNQTAPSSSSTPRPSDDSTVAGAGAKKKLKVIDISNKELLPEGAPVTPLREGLHPIDGRLILSKEAHAVLQERHEQIEAKQQKRLLDATLNPPEHLPMSVRTNSKEATGLYSVACYPTERLPFPDNSFDTVVDMFGLCSFDDPVLALREMSRVCKPTGKLLLLEHGKGSWEKMNEYLDKWAPRHACMWGCWWNRDIRRFVRLSGVHVVEREEKHFGTTHYMVLTPFKSLAESRDFLMSQQQQKTNGEPGSGNSKNGAAAGRGTSRQK